MSLSQCLASKSVSSWETDSRRTRLSSSRTLWQIRGPLVPVGTSSCLSDGYHPEKGIQTLLRAMDHLAPGIKLNIVGVGPLEMDVRAAALGNPSINYLGRVSQREVLSLIGNSICLVFPSEWYETFGRVAAEAFARGTPVIASEIGAVAEIVEHDRTGFYSKPGDALDLARVMTLAFTNPEQLIGMRVAARQEYENKYTADKNYEMMMAIYGQAIASGQRSKAAWSRGGKHVEALRMPGQTAR